MMIFLLLLMLFLLLLDFYKDHAECAYDKLVLSDEIDGHTQCGGGENQLPPPMELRGKKVRFAFTSDGDSSATGFYLNYRVTRHDKGEEE